MLPVDYRTLLPSPFHPTSRVWVYQSDRPLIDKEARELDIVLQAFVGSWSSHGTPVKGYAQLFHRQFIILMADESAAAVSGCSTDSSVHLIKEVEQTFQIKLFDRQTLAFLIRGNISLLTLRQVEAALQEGIITADTIYFNNIVATKEALENDWLIPVKDSWLVKKFSLEKVT